MARTGSDATTGFQTNSPQCPCRLMSPVVNGSGVAAAVESFSLELPAVDLIARRDKARFVSVARLRHSGRGPPAFSL
jgi:hypothetical protein